MSGEATVDVINIDAVDVDNSAKENGTNSEKSSDSGVETTDASSETFPASSDSDTSPIKSIMNEEIEFNPTSIRVDSAAKITDEIVSFQSSATSNPISITPEDDCTSDSPHSIESPIKSENTKELFTNDDKYGARTLEIYDTKETDVPDYKQNNLEFSNAVNSIDNSIQTHNTGHISSCESLDDKNASQIIMNNLALSTMSLDEKTAGNPMIKSQFSRSAENIPLLNTEHKTFSMGNHLDKEDILTQFSIQKKQVNATQRIPENVTEPALDVRYTRIPKEILSQDIGSIVKNVHGMFSSVSGSLKYYTHRTATKPVKNLKPIPNSKVMTDIFEDEINEPTKLDQEISNEPVEEMKDQDLDPKSEVLRLQIESLERLLFEQRKENTSLRERVKQHVDDSQDKENMFKELEGKLDSVSDHTVI